MQTSTETIVLPPVGVIKKDNNVSTKIQTLLLPMSQFPGKRCLDMKT